MAIVLIQMPTVNPIPTLRPKECPYCSSQILQRWGSVQKPLRDTDFEVVVAYRFRCIQCTRTFRHYPDGVDKADMSQRLRCLAAMAWSMGLSLRGVGTIFSAFGEGLKVGRMSVWRAASGTGEGSATTSHSQIGTNQASGAGAWSRWGVDTPQRAYYRCDDSCRYG